MEDERGVVGVRRAGGVGCAAQVGLQREAAGGSIVERRELDDRHAFGGCGGAGGGVVALLDDHGAGFEVGEVEAEFVGAVAGIERRGGGGRGDGEEGGGHFGAVGQDDGDGVAAPEAEAVERRRGALNLLAEVGERKRLARGRAEGGAGSVVGGEQLGDGGCGGRCGHGRPPVPPAPLGVLASWLPSLL